MILELFFILFLLLLGIFFLATMSASLTHLSEALSLPMLQRSLYFRLHALLFKERRFQLLLLTTQIGQTLLSVAYTLVVLVLLEQFPLSLLVEIGIPLLLLLVLARNLLPRLFAIRSPKSALHVALLPSSLLLFLCLPFSWAFIKLFEKGLRKSESSTHFLAMEEMKETLLQILHAAHFSGKLTATDKKLLSAVIRFRERIVREVMVPRVDLFCLGEELSIRESAKLLVHEGYSRTPVYRETIDQIVGVLMFKDILELYMDCESGKKEFKVLDASIGTVMKPVFYTPETKKAALLLQEFRSRQMHMAIVVDEYGGTEGIVTIEDILEEIVGEIADEYDIDEETLYSRHPSDGGWIVDARMTLLDAEDIFGIHIPQEGEYDTIGGYIFHKMGAIPVQGARIHHEDFDLEILSSTERSVEKVRITPRGPS